MDTNQLKRILAGFGVATLLAGVGAAGTGCVTADEKPAATGCSGDKAPGKSGCSGDKSGAGGTGKPGGSSG